MPTYNLVDSAWIPCRNLNGKTEFLGIRDVLLRAHELSELRDESPLVTAALHRLLIAIGHRVVDGPNDDQHWMSLWHAGRFDESSVISYVDNWRHRFDLLDSERPFWQVPNFTIIDPNTGAAQKPASLAGLIHEMASGSNATLFDHNHDGVTVSADLATCARAVVAFQCFAVAGGNGAKSNVYGKHPNLSGGPGIGSLTVIIRGESFFQTLMLNMLTKHRWPIQSLETDAPVWERPIMATAGQRMPDGYVDYLTCTPRALRLLYEDTTKGVTVSGAYIAQGELFKSNEDIPPPFSPRVLSQKDERLLPLSLDPNRVLWRDSYALYVSDLSSNSDNCLKPRNLLQLATFLETDWGDDHRELPCSVFGLAKDQGKLLAWRHEEWPIPRRLVTDDLVALRLKDAIQIADDIGQVVWSAAHRLGLYIVAGDGSKEKPTKAEKNNANKVAGRTTYWDRLDTHFWRFVRSLSDDPEKAIASWIETCRREAKAAFKQAADDLIGRSAKDLKERVEIEEAFKRNLFKTLGEATNE